MHLLTTDRHKQPYCGFTLLEVMVALAILAIVMVSVYKMHSQSLAMSTEARFYTQAPMLAQSKLAELETTSKGEISDDSGDFGEKFPGYNWKVSVSEVTSGTLGEIANDLKMIDVTVTYNSDEFIYSFRTYRFNREQ